jgi:hypothetical protein
MRIECIGSIHQFNRVSISLILIPVLFCGVAEAQTPGARPPSAVAAKTDRTWGPISHGVRAFLSVDRLTYHLGEDVPLHISIENVSATQTIFDETPQMQSIFYGGPTASIRLTVLDGEEGPLNPRFDMSSSVVEAGGLSTCPSPLLPGKPSSFEGSLSHFGLLPSKPGAYKITVTWSPDKVNVPGCDTHVFIPIIPSTPPKPIFSVSSNPVYLEIEGDSPSSTVPEYIAWKNHFSLTDTSFGEKTALLDKKTNLEWLRLDFSADLSLDQVRAQTAADGQFAGWRIATSKELRLFFANFTGLPTGHSTDPIIAHKLQRLLGGPLEQFSDPTIGYHREHSEGFVAEPTVPDGNMVHFQVGFILEDSNALIGAKIDPESGLSASDRGYASSSLGSFLVRHK